MLVLDVTARRSGRARPTRRSPEMKATSDGDSFATSSTPPARPASPRASRSLIRASAISCALQPSATASSPGDRVYQGMSVAFDFSIEEIWVPLVAGATLVPNTARDQPVRRGARRFPRDARRHLPLLRADAARLDRARAAEAAHPADRRRGLPAGAGQALEPAGPHAAQQLRPDRSDGHRDARRADARAGR